MSFLAELDAWPRERVEDLIHRATLDDVDRAIAREERTVEDLAALLSPCVAERLETVAGEAQRLTRWHFGRTIGLYAPIYISNICEANCLYCGYATGSGNKEKRVTLTPEQIRRECEALAAYGFQNVLLLTGEAPTVATMEYIGEGVAIAREHFPAVSIEMYAMTYEQYAYLCRRGLEGVTLYIETYDRPTYARVHQGGVKKDFLHRLDAIERAGRAGARRLSIGALLGLSDWRVEGFRLGLHARYLQKQCWQSAVALSFPRLRNVPTRFAIPRLLSDRELVQLMLALRLFLPEAGFNLSTREPAELRDHLIPLGVTMMSAGSSTRPGGYAAHARETLEQFAIEDTRPPEAVVQAIRSTGYDPVWKDFDWAYDAVENE